MPNPFTAANSTRLLFAAVSVVLLVTAFLLGFATGRTNADLAYQSGREAGYAAGLEDAGASPGSPLPAAAAGPVTSLTGTVTAIADGRIVFTAAGQERTVTPGADTKFQLLSERDPVEYQKELAAYARIVPKPGSPPTPPPSPSVTTALAFADLAVGDTITVSVAPDKDIKEAVEIADPLSVTKIAIPATSAAVTAGNGAPLPPLPPPPPPPPPPTTP